VLIYAANRPTVPSEIVKNPELQNPALFVVLFQPLLNQVML